MHQRDHNGVATTAAKTRVKYWIQRVHDLAKFVKFKCVTCREMAKKVENQLKCDLPPERLSPFTPTFHITSCDYFDLTKKKLVETRPRNVMEFCFLAYTRAVHLELAVDCSTMEFIQVLRRFFAIRDQPPKLFSDNGTQLVAAEKELREMVKGWNVKELQDFSAERSVEWKFITPAAPHHNGCAEAMVKSGKLAIKRATGDQRLTDFELYTVFMEVANLVNQRPIGRTPTTQMTDLTCAQMTYC